jgi:hypothetical protein
MPDGLESAGRACAEDTLQPSHFPSLQALRVGPGPIVARLGCDSDEIFSEAELSKDASSSRLPNLGVSAACLVAWAQAQCLCRLDGAPARASDTGPGSAPDCGCSGPLPVGTRRRESAQRARARKRASARKRARVRTSWSGAWKDRQWLGWPGHATVTADSRRRRLG